MSHRSIDDAQEEQRDWLDNNLAHELMEYGKDYSRLEFLWWLIGSLHKNEVASYLESWVKTKEGKDWYEERLEKLVDLKMDETPEPEDAAGSDR